MLKQDVTISTREFAPSTVGDNNGTPAEFSGKLPPRAVPVESGPVTKWINRIYDAALCLAPICLILKTGLVIRAHHVDKYSGTGVMNPASSLTENLVYFNGQVRPLPMILMLTTY
jgi:hypothetical protein